MPRDTAETQNTSFKKKKNVGTNKKMNNKAKMVFRVFPTDSSNFSFIKFLLNYFHFQKYLIALFKCSQEIFLKARPKAEPSLRRLW